MQGPQDRPAGSTRAGIWLGRVVSVVAQAVARHLGIDPSTPLAGVLILLEDQGAGALSYHQPVPVAVKRPADGGAQGHQDVEAGKGQHAEWLSAIRHDDRRHGRGG